MHPVPVVIVHLQHSRSSSFPFADVNPNYQMNEDIWGANADIKTLEQAKFLEKPDWETKRVKDSCLMA